MSNVPEFLTREQLLLVLDDITQRITAGDSFEGFFEYTLPWDAEMGDPETDEDKDGYRVRASYRVGNLQGQGGMRMVGRLS